MDGALQSGVSDIMPTMSRVGLWAMVQANCASEGASRIAPGSMTHYQIRSFSSGRRISNPGQSLM